MKLLKNKNLFSNLAKKNLGISALYPLRNYSNGAKGSEPEMRVSTERRNKHRQPGHLRRSFWEDPWQMMSRSFDEDFFKNFMRDPFDTKNWPSPDFAISKFQDSDFLPSVDVKEHEDSLSIMCDLPGMSKENVKVRVEEGNVLCIEGERMEEKEEKESKRHKMERRFGKFTRRFSLPENANVESLKASFKDGVLQINIQKKPVEKTNVREVQIE